MRLTIVGSKRKSPKRRNFKFGRNNGFGGVFKQTHYVRILPVKIPRFSNGEVVDFDLYDLLQGEKNSETLTWLYFDIVIVTSL